MSPYNLPVTVLRSLCPSDIDTASIGPRSVVATGPEELEASKWELEADTEKFIRAAEVNVSRETEVYFPC